MVYDEDMPMNQMEKFDDVYKDFAAKSGPSHARAALLLSKKGPA